MTTPSTLRSRLDALEQRAKELATEGRQIEEGIQQIDIDLSNTLAEFVEDTGRQPYEFYKWRRKAKWARAHKINNLQRLNDRARALDGEQTETAMLLYALESGYRGQNPEQLLTAAYYLVMDVIGECGYQPDENQLGLVFAIKERVGAHAPGVESR
ncbi:MAG: hypothetical protein H0U67_16605 [Gemmatimonadetes bacterium]|nr:hypothetical protein [Gemmatimonadota bacterium]